MNNKLKTKDLIFTGIFAALYMAVMMATVSILGFMPITYLAAPFFASITCAPVYMLFALRIRKTGPVLILSILMGLFMMQASPVAAVWAVICGIVAEIIIRMGKFQSKKHYNISFIVFTLTILGTYLAIWFSKDVYIAQTLQYYGQEYADTLNALTPAWIVPVLFVTALIGGSIGVLLTNKILKKHFERAEII